MGDDEDVVMGETPAYAIPVDSGQPASRSPEKSTSSNEMNGTTTESHAQSLLETFQRKVVSPGSLVREAEAHLASPPTTKKPETEKIKPEEESDSESDDGASVLSHDKDDEVVQGLPLASRPTGLCYDIRMRYHCEVNPTLDVHPEDPRRIYYIYKELCKAGLVDDPESSRPLVSQPLLRIDARDATEEEISLVHATEHYAFVESTKGV